MGVAVVEHSDPTDRLFSGGSPTQDALVCPSTPAILAGKLSFETKPSRTGDVQG